MSDVKLPLAAQNPGRRWYQYSLRSLLILVTLRPSLAVGLP